MCCRMISSKPPSLALAELIVTPGRRCNESATFLSGILPMSSAVITSTCDSALRFWFSDCSRDACVALIRKGPREWRLLATRSAMRIDWATIAAACAEADIVVSDRRLPRGCQPRWLKLDRAALARSGGLAIYLGKRSRVDSVADRVGAHPWAGTWRQ